MRDAAFVLSARLTSDKAGSLRHCIFQKQISVSPYDLITNTM